MKKTIQITLILFLLSGGFWKCKKDELPNGMNPSYFKIYDDQDANNRYKTLDIIETADGGALILASLNETRIYLLRVNKQGEYMASQELGNMHRSALPKLLRLNGRYFIACMDEVGLFTQILNVDENTCQANTAAEYTDLLYPLAVSPLDGDNALLLSYDRIGYKSQLSKISLSGSVEWTLEIPVNQDAEALIVQHLNGSGVRFPFYTEVWNGKYVVNCFSNYSFSFLIMKGGTGMPDAIYNGSQYASGTSACYPLASGSVAISRFSFGKSYLIPSFNQPFDVVDLTDNLGGIFIEEAEANSEFKLGNITVDDVNYLGFAYNTQNSRVALGLLDGNGQLKARKYFGTGTNPFKIGQFRQTEDKGLLLAGTLSVAGVFPRPALFKLNEKELFEILDLEYE
jgi:hypothetical protein